MEIWSLLQNQVEDNLEINLSIVGLSYSLEQKQLFQLANLDVLKQIYGPKMSFIIKEGREKVDKTIYTDVFMNYFGKQPDYSMPIPDGIGLFLKHVFQFY